MVPKEPHFHLLLFLRRKFRISSILRWFYRIDDKGLVETVTGTGISNPELAYAYLTHKFDYDKYQYPYSRVKASSKAFFENLSSRSSDDTLTNAFYDRQAGAGVDELIKKYGRDFILHYDKIMHLCRISALENERKRSSERLDFFDELYEIN